MLSFEIFTDSSCDLPKEMIEQYDLKVMQLEVIIDDKPPVLNSQIIPKDFYSLLREGANVKTSAVTPGFFEEHMRAALQEGKDILYLGFSSGLSATYNNGVMVIKELQEEFPDRKISYLDTLCASVGQGLLVYYAALLREKGASIDEVLEKADAMKDYIQHQVTVDDLFFLKRGGRIGATTAIAGTLLQFKPLIVLTEEGKLENFGKVRGRKASVAELFKRMKANQNLKEFEYVFISHSDCAADVELLVGMIQEEWSNAKVIVGDIGPVIGAHTGPGAIALCYVGNEIKGTDR